MVVLLLRLGLDAEECVHDLQIFKSGGWRSARFPSFVSFIWLSDASPPTLTYGMTDLQQQTMQERNPNLDMDVDPPPVQQLKRKASSGACLSLSRAPPALFPWPLSRRVPPRSSTC